MNKLMCTGGARIGWANATWPFAKLIVTAEKLKLNVSFLGGYEFHKGQIISIKKYGFIPIIGRGIRIKHNIASYPQKIVFWTFGSPGKLIKNIEQTGLLTGEPGTITQQTAPRKTGFPLKIFPVVSVVIIWNLLILADQDFSLSKISGKPGVFSMIALFFAFGTSLAIKKIRLLLISS
ncbi:MAG: hypothetical protein JXA04_03705 [Gammaproteobacteria bacterium]|nr:hypothetical protein [Gammaproteobacteria bacterium]